ncbi:MAG: hypothetical protein ACEQSH_00105 [Bacteroidia bacterium]
MPQTSRPTQPAVNPSHEITPLQVDANGALITIQGGVSVNPTVTTTLGTVTSTGTYQAALPANANRLAGGSIINHGTATMQVQFAAVATANGAKSNNLGDIAAKGGRLDLASVLGGSPYTGVISITGTAADTFSTVELKSS